VLLVALVAATGITTAVLAARLIDASIDRSLETGASAALAQLHESRGDSVDPGTSVVIGQPAASDSESENESDPGEAQPTAAPGNAAPSAAIGAPSPGAPTDSDDHPPAAADTFFLYLDQAGNVIGNPERVTLAGLPIRDAITSAALTGRDLRTVDLGTVRVRLLTIPVGADDDPTGQIRTLQAGFVLKLHDEQMDTLLRSILIVGLGAILGAAVVTIVLTRRALVPVRAALDRERRFVAAASHELRTPIAVIRSSAEVLSREGRVEPEGEPMVEDIVSEADRVAGLVAELSELVVAQARPPVPTTPVDLVAVATDVSRRARPLAEEHGLRLETELGPAARTPGTSAGRSAATPAVTVRADRDRLVQVALILIDNAMRHSPAGGTVAVSAVREHGRGLLTVADDGPGIPETDRERIFEPFARLATPRRPVGTATAAGTQGTAAEGAGLGLAIARAIVDGMGGQVSVTDAPSGGALFIVSLPLA
jgi:signal transduction histidine kinase